MLKGDPMVETAWIGSTPPIENECEHVLFPHEDISLKKEGV